LTLKMHLAFPLITFIENKKTLLCAGVNSLHKNSGVRSQESDHRTHSVAKQLTNK